VMRTSHVRRSSVCLALLVGCMLAGNARAGVFRLRRMVVVGDSLLAGVGSGGLVGVGNPKQADSAPAFIARRAHGLDGIHPTRTGNALVANVFIDAIDARFGEAIPPVDVTRVAAHDPLAHSSFRPVGEVPFGLIGDSEGDDLESFFTKTFTRIGDRADDLRNRLEHLFDVF
jgi:hypothetical protein